MLLVCKKFLWKKSYNELFLAGDTESSIVVRHVAPLTVDDKQLWIDFGNSHQFHIYLQAGGMQEVELYIIKKYSPAAFLFVVIIQDQKNWNGLYHHLKKLILKIYFHTSMHTVSISFTSIQCSHEILLEYEI